MNSRKLYQALSSLSKGSHKKKSKGLCKLFCVLLGVCALAFSSHGFEFQPHKKIGETKLVLNGSGTKEATFLALKIYDVGLYLKQQSNNPKQILALKEPAYISLRFRISVTKAKLRRSWLEDLYHACPQSEAPLMQQAQNLSKLLPDIKKGQVVSYLMHDNYLTVFVNDKKLGEIRNESARKCVLSAFIGEGMRDHDLKRKLLGR